MTSPASRRVPTAHLESMRWQARPTALSVQTRAESMRIWTRRRLVPLSVPARSSANKAAKMRTVTRPRPVQSALRDNMHWGECTTQTTRPRTVSRVRQDRTLHRVRCQANANAVRQALRTPTQTPGRSVLNVQLASSPPMPQARTSSATAEANVCHVRQGEWTTTPHPRLRVFCAPWESIMSASVLLTQAIVGIASLGGGRRRLGPQAAWPALGSRTAEKETTGASRVKQRLESDATMRAPHYHPQVQASSFPTLPSAISRS